MDPSVVTSLAPADIPDHEYTITDVLFTYAFPGFESSPVVCPCDYVFDFGVLGPPEFIESKVIKSV